MGSVIVILFFGICGIFTSKSEKQRLMNQEAAEWFEEQNS